MICGFPQYMSYADRSPFRPLPRGCADRCPGLKHRQSIVYLLCPARPIHQRAAVKQSNHKERRSRVARKRRGPSTDCHLAVSVLPAHCARRWMVPGRPGTIGLRVQTAGSEGSGRLGRYCASYAGLQPAMRKITVVCAGDRLSADKQSLINVHWRA